MDILDELGAFDFVASECETHISSSLIVSLEECANFLDIAMVMVVSEDGGG